MAWREQIPVFVILREAKNLSFFPHNRREILRFAQNGNINCQIGGFR